MKRKIIYLFFSIAFYLLTIVNCQLSIGQSDSTYWNREFHFGTTVFLDRKDLDFYTRDGNFLPGYSASYALKKINNAGFGGILNFGVNTFSWKSVESDYHEFLGEDFVPVVRAQDYSLFRYTFSHIAYGFYYRKKLPDLFLEVDLSPGMQIFSFTRLRDVRNFITGAIYNLRDEQNLRFHVAPSVEMNTRLAYRLSYRHLLFFNFKFIGFFDLKPFNYYSFLAFNVGLSKDFMLTKRKLKKGKKFRDNYLYAEGLGIGGFYSMNYERNISKYANFKLNLRAGFSYLDSYNYIAGINLVLGHQIDRFELAATYNYQKLLDNDIPNHWMLASVAYRAETLKNWMFRLSAGPAVKLQNDLHEFNVIFGASIGKKFGKK